MNKFHQYTYKRSVVVQKDHNPLVAIQKKPFARPPMRLQRMLIRLQADDFELVHVPGKDLHIADTLSRAATGGRPKTEVFDTVNTVVVSDLTSAELAELQQHIQEDEPMRKLLHVVREGWPEKNDDCDSCLTPYWPYRDELSTCEDVLLKGQALIIPKKLRTKYLKLAHKAHLGADSCIRRARDAIFCSWPAMSADLKALVTQCEACAKYAPRQQKEPLMQPDTPQRAWNSVSADIMSLRGKEYLVTVDALSGFFEIDLLRQQTAAEVIIKLKMHSARYGTPMPLATDNGPQFASKQFAEFAKKWRFDHRTSSPHYPRSNGQAEAAVKVAKSILRKVQHEKSDVYMALLDYRNTPRTTTGLSPAEVLLQRKTRSATLLPQPLTASPAENTAHSNKTKRQAVIKKHHDKTAAPLPPLPRGRCVWYARWNGDRENWARGKIIDTNGRSYIITAENGATYRRNRVQIRPDLTNRNQADDTDA